jgi:hypothetical protein
MGLPFDANLTRAITLQLNTRDHHENHIDLMRRSEGHFICSQNNLVACSDGALYFNKPSRITSEAQ